ncbi:CDP-glycerol glycerophosphotransferase family protein [Lysinibacillus xylanilyticus]|uniref:CDP-glycerol glycerophosphotransferase family protein n=1 Tax=Lysinibacillus xylanilyticus TaxID=582475 RepID=UPI002B248D7F|nr:CDP-glycerol glycerophosphotransferase family protein [Lysinibacillus xylanilyticus]MEB2298033.1 CDP-glycerol glycerophosphotransferase family protein [Lysinibacillus xylanilyticus]
MFPIKNRIVFESNPSFSGNSYALFKEMQQRNISASYQLFWISNGEEPPINDKNINIIDISRKDFRNLCRYYWFMATSKIIIYENRPLDKLNQKQIMISLQHGTPIKQVADIKMVGYGYDYVLCTSNNLNPILSEVLHVREESLINLGFPRNDYLFKEDSEILKSLKEKMVIWLPTFRQHKNKTLATDKSYPLGIPLINNENDLLKLDNILKKLNIKLVIKPHPAQDMTYLNIKSLNNFKVINDDVLKKNGMHLYELIGKSSALITDYSSVYFDYLLLNRPIAFTNDDIQLYKQGFVFEDITEVLKGTSLSDLNDLLIFLEEVNSGNDEFLKEREIIKNWSHDNLDDSSSKRIADFIEKLIH